MTIMAVETISYREADAAAKSDCCMQSGVEHFSAYCHDIF